MTRAWLLPVLLLGMGRAAMAETIPPRELERPPMAARVTALQAEAARTDWGPAARELRATAVGLYQRQAAEAQAWYYLYRWADLFAQSQRQAVVEWIQANRRSGPPNPNLHRRIEVSDRPMAGLWPAGLQLYALTSEDFSSQFFTLRSSLDQPVKVLQILATLWNRDPATFKEYANLALAIAVVYDVPPPPGWPHGQVSPRVLPRRLPPPAEAFAFFVRADRNGSTLESLRQLPAVDLKFVVDTSASFPDMVWAQQHLHTPLDDLARLYGLIRYRRDRVQANVLMWPGPAYGLPDILRAGGICVDQAYFAAMAGKALGVPTLLFRGAGLDGRHAWFGYLDGRGQWHLDCGRYANQGLVSGVAYDPQTWTNISDHELKFLSEGFRLLPRYRQSKMHRQFAALFFDSGDYEAAARAARSAVNIEPRNLQAWFLLIGALQHLKARPQRIEGVMAEAARAFQAYPDLAAGFRTLWSRSERARGNVSLANEMERTTAREYQGTREDLSVQQARDILQRSLDAGDVNASIRTYYGVLQSYGPGGGMDFFDQIVHPFVEYLLQHDRAAEARQAVGQARQTLHVEPDSQLDGELKQLAGQVRQALH